MCRFTSLRNVWYLYVLSVASVLQTIIILIEQAFGSVLIVFLVNSTTVEIGTYIGEFRNV